MRRRLRTTASTHSGMSLITFEEGEARIHSIITYRQPTEEEHAWYLGFSDDDIPDVWACNVCRGE